MAALDYAKAGMYASDANFGSRRGLADPTVANNLGNRGAGAMLRVGLITGALFVASLNPVEWHKFNSGITVTGSGVSQWDDATGLGHHLLQGTDAARPPLQSDGSVLFDGSAQFLRASGYALNQPETVYLLIKQVTWTGNDTVSDGNAANTMRITQASISPQLSIHAGSAVAANDGLQVNDYGVACAVFNGATSQMQINHKTPTTGNAGAGNAGGFALGYRPAPDGFANMQAKEAIIFADAHVGITRARMIVYAAGVGKLYI